MNRQRVEIIGRVVQNPEIKKSKSDNSYSQVRVAVNARSKDRKGNAKDKATFYNVLTFGKRAEKVTRIQKGTLVRAMGELDADPYLSKKGEAKIDLTVIANDFHVFDSQIFK